MVFLRKICDKIYNSKLLKILVYFMMVIETLAFLLLPWFKYGNDTLKITLIIVWAILTALVIFSFVTYLAYYIYALKREKLTKNHAVFWVSLSTFLVALVGIFLTAFIIQNFHKTVTLGIVFLIISSVLIGLGIASIILSNRKRTYEFIKLLTVVFVIVFFALILLVGIIFYQPNNNLSKALIIIGGATLVLAFTSIFVKTSIKLGESDSLVKESLKIIALFGILSALITIITVYSVKKDNQDVVATIASVVLGGVVTLLSVVMTIKRQERDRKIEEERQVVPYLQLVNVPISSDKIEFTTVIKDCGPDVWKIGFRNCGKEPCILKKVSIGAKSVGLKDKLISAGGYFFINFEMSKPTSNKVFMCVNDIYENNYIYVIDGILGKESQFRISLPEKN